MRFLLNPVRHLPRLRARFGDVVGLVEGGNPPLFSPGLGGLEERTVFVFGPAATRAVLLRPAVFQTLAPRQASDAARRLSENVLYMNGERHRARRRLLMTGLSRDNLRRLHDEELVACCQRELGTWRDGQTLELFDRMREITMRVACRCFLGLEVQDDAPAMAMDMRAAMNTMFSPAAMLPVDLPGTPHRRLRRLMERIERGLLREIERKRRGALTGNDLLSRLLRAVEDEQGVTDHELAGQAFVLFFAGHDTSTCGLTWTLFLLAQHPSAADEVMAEVDEVLGDRPPTYEQLERMPALERVIKESLRLLSPVTMFTRIAKQDTQILDFAIPRGAEVLYSPYVTHLDGTTFLRPRRFSPERWRDLKPSEFEYLPFGSGPRRCLGGGFASMQLRSVVAQVLQRFRLVIPDGTRIDPSVNVVMSPRKALPVELRPRTSPGRRAELRGQILEMVDFGR